MALARLGGVLSILKRIITQLTANNQISVRYYDRPNCLKQRNVGDGAREDSQVRLGKDAQEYEWMTKILSHVCKEYVHVNECIVAYVQPDILEENKRTYVEQYKRKVVVEATACAIPPKIEYTTIVNNKPYIISETYESLCRRRSGLLDIIKKSQQAKKRERPWGKVQSIKKFTLNAKQKILEAGAVVDKHTTPDSRFMLTLTVPGSGIDVYDAVARYSGYIVNRLTQIIRRWEAKGVRVYWFFVWEHQKRGALHMHWCLTVDNSPAMSRILCKQIRAKWFDLLEELSVKTCIDLFKKKGFMGTWRYSPEVWQSDIQAIEKSVAAYFSKYLSKNCETSRFNRERSERQESLRKKYPDRAKYARVISLCPSRYWGCGTRVKQLCKRYRVDVCFDVASRQEGDFIASFISKWLGQISNKLTQVSRSFKKVAPDTGFIYCKGWEAKIWFEADVMDAVLRLYKRLRANQERKIDAIGAILDLDDF